MKESGNDILVQNLEDKCHCTIVFDHNYHNGVKPRSFSDQKFFF